MKLEDYLKEQLKNPEFRKEYEAFKSLILPKLIIIKGCSIMKYKGVLMWLNSHKKHLISNEEYGMAEVIDDAIEIINLHTPEKPKLESYGSSYVFFCPNCNEEIGKNDFVCKNCTKLIDWSDSDDGK